MSHLFLCLLVQLSLAFGLAGLFWPEKFMPLFKILMFPWAASYRTVRANSVVALAISAILAIKLVIVGV
jgi:hypothetical protein